MPNIKSIAAEIKIYKNCISDYFGCLESALESALDCLSDSESSFIIDKRYNSIEELVIDLYDQDNVYLFTSGSYDINWDLISEEWDKADWVDSPNEVSHLEEMYGEEGTNYYKLFTRNKIHSFSEITPFGEGKDYNGAELR